MVRTNVHCVHGGMKEVEMIGEGGSRSRVEFAALQITN
jgi:hypothetical protein